MTSKARSRMYGELNKNLADSFIVILGFFFLGKSFPSLSSAPSIFETILSCICLYAAIKTPPDAKTAPIK